MVYCRSGARSSRAAEIMQANGFKKVYNLSGGIMGWNGEIIKP
ncbi:MAG: rhodanese-like domain-containing protein [Bacteroidia bacterium]|nr:rhodanese-like domain-containing protein [Bacteroidia bacterium]